MRHETSFLLAALRELDEGMVELMLGLLIDELPAGEQRRFGQLFAAAGKLLEQHAEFTTGPAEVVGAGDEAVHRS